MKWSPALMPVPFLPCTAEQNSTRLRALASSLLLPCLASRDGRGSAEQEWGLRSPKHQTTHPSQQLPANQQEYLTGMSQVLLSSQSLEWKNNLQWLWACHVPEYHSAQSADSQHPGKHTPHTPEGGSLLFSDIYFFLLAQLLTWELPWRFH